MTDPAPLPTRPLVDQISEVRRELALRDGVYSMMIARGKMTKEEAAEHIARMQATLKTLIFFHRNEVAIRRVFAGQEP